jgi:AcrR family transcriptional regulator
VAVQYHFTDRDGILRAITEKHYPDIERRRHEMLDDYEQDQRAGIIDLSAALVAPAAAKLSDPDGGLEYLQIHAQVLQRPRYVEPAPSRGPLNSIDRWRAMVEPFLEQDATRLHRRFTAIRFTASELGRRAESGPHKDDRLFMSHLVDLVAALLVAPVSPLTSRLAVDRDRSLQLL